MKPDGGKEEKAKARAHQLNVAATVVALVLSFAWVALAVVGAVAAVTEPAAQERLGIPAD